LGGEKKNITIWLYIQNFRSGKKGILWRRKEGTDINGTRPIPNKI